MTLKKLEEVLNIYEEYFTKLKNENCLVESLKHCSEMIPRMRVFIEEGKIDKVNRWLGFIQGCLWMERHFTIAELMNHNTEKLEDNNKGECEKVIRYDNSILIYGMTKENIEKQMECNHPNWYGPCIDEISRYYKCRECYCLKRDMTLDEWTRRG